MKKRRPRGGAVAGGDRPSERPAAASAAAAAAAEIPAWAKDLEKRLTDLIQSPETPTRDVAGLTKALLELKRMTPEPAAENAPAVNTLDELERKRAARQGSA